MTSLQKTAALALLCLAGALVAGCSMRPQKYSTIPQSQPASWEGQIPGMGQPSGR